MPHPSGVYANEVGLVWAGLGFSIHHAVFLSPVSDIVVMIFIYFSIFFTWCHFFSIGGLFHAQGWIPEERDRELSGAAKEEVG